MRWSTFAAIVTVTVLIVAVLFSGSTFAQQTPVKLSAGAGAPGASGIATFGFVGGVAVGTVNVNNLPPQPFASGRFYGVWFVRTDTGSKAFLGTLINKQSIIFSSGGNGQMEFHATQFTDGPGFGFPITLGAAGTNFLVVLIEDVVNGLTPSPIGPVPGTGVAVGGTF